MQVYLINLDRSPERLHFFEEQTQEVGIEFERISAVDGRLLSDEELAAAVMPTYEFQPLNAGEIGVFLSHKRAWERLVASREPYAVVFEDDVVLSPSLRADFEAIDTVQPAFDIIKLESTLRSVVCGRQATPLTSASGLQPLLTWHGGAAGYVISSDCAKRLLQQRRQLADPVDQVLFNPMSSISSQLEIHQLIPAACVQKDILEKSVSKPVSKVGSLKNKTAEAFGTTIDRNLSGGRIFRHGPLIDFRRLLKKQAERRRRKQLARRAENIEAVIPFQQSPFQQSSPMRCAS